jgi:hypothetical protein
VVVALADIPTVPDPVPLPLPLTVAQLAPLVALQGQPAPAVTVTLVEPPPPGSFTEVGLTLTEHAASCVTVKVEPATVRVPVRGDAAVFAVAVTVALPPPVPEAPDVIDNHGALLVAVQAQDVCVVTVVLAEPPAPLMFAVVGVRLKLHAC